MTNIKHPVGRPSTYTPEIASEICATIASSTKGTKRLCNQNPHWPCQDTLFSWLKNHSEFSEQYAQAKRCQVEVLVDDMLEIADDPSLDTPVAINRARLQIDTRKWLACKLVPRVYGNNVDNMSLDSNNHEESLKFLK